MVHIVLFNIQIKKLKQVTTCFFEFWEEDLNVVLLLL